MRVSAARIAELPDWPRGMRVAVAAAYVGVCVNTFKKQVSAGIWPAAQEVNGIKIWDRKGLDEAFDAMQGKTPSSGWEDAFNGIKSATRS